MQSLQIELVICLNRHKSHVLAIHWGGVAGRDGGARCLQHEPSETLHSLGPDCSRHLGPRTVAGTAHNASDRAPE